MTDTHHAVIERATPALSTRPASISYRKESTAMRWIILVVTLIVAAVVLTPFLTSPALRWDVVAQFMVDPLILAGIGKTLLLTVVAMVIAIVFGTIVAAMRATSDPTLRAVGWLYVNFMRAVPLLVLILFAYFLAVFVPQLTLGVPFTDLTLVSIDTNSVISPFTASVIALGFGEAAYTSEIIRGGVLAVDKGQLEAATALGMKSRTKFARIVTPQAFRVIVPALGNETVGMLKATSLVQIIGFTELLTTAQRIYATNFQTIPLLVVVTAWYVILTTIGTVGQHFLERRMSRGFK